MKFIFIGEFKTSGTLRISDPCYDKKAVHTGTINVKPGKWSGYIFNDFTGIPTHLFAYHKGSNNLCLSGISWELTDIQAGVDSGMCGIYDNNRYKAYEKDIYKSICKIIAEEKQPLKDIQTQITIKEQSFNKPELNRLEFDRITADVLVLIEKLQDAQNKQACVCRIGNYGVVSATNFGDGIYPVYIIKINNEVIGIKIDFIYEDRT